ncbi:P-II family nitrogen regulator [Roseiconus lacunae]|uniref:P-II family nitrogen regulator n=1 Tax=Roseiconus lacunae TaxID=2605694 RepID=UPI0011F2F44A|nr:P-II family nitrogen regulator [Roseiconus lacunae]MCD0460108.1 P-II family nitrogen regulator [Roseiconus lacunae]WRQ50573.1 P-II family nitrogen regulator [Stieleria sp. HD01]
MRVVVAIIQPTKLSNVRDALRELDVEDMTICDAMGYGRQRGQSALFRGNEYKVDLLRKVVVEIMVHEDQLEHVIDAITRQALTGSAGQIGDGKIFVLPVADVIDMADEHPEYEPGW